MHNKAPDYHIPILGLDVSKNLITDPKGIYIDATLGGGGHADILLNQLHSESRLIGIDRDTEALKTATARLSKFNDRVTVIQSPFWHLQHILTNLGISRIHGVLFDLGLSSHQIDAAERGFSFQQNGPLDMRMGPDAALTAQDVIATYSHADLVHIFKTYGEERHAGSIAKAICIARSSEPITSTRALADVIARQVRGPHVQKTLARIFQAIRIEVNSELAHLESVLQTAIDMLHPGGRIAVLSYHSLEHRAVKTVFQLATQRCIGPLQLPVCLCKREPVASIVVRSLRPDQAEIAANPRARSATLRVAERKAIDPQPWICRQGT